MDPHISIRQKHHDFKIHLHQALVPPDFERRLACIAWLTEAREEGIISNILWSDETRFNNNGIVNRHNCHYWASENPHWLRETNFQHIWGINVWCGIINSQIIGPKFYEGNLNSQIYLEFLVNELPVLLEDVLLVVKERMYFQQDGAPPHNVRITTDYLNDTFPHRWIGKNEANRWPVRSPDLTPLDFFVGLFIS